MMQTVLLVRATGMLGGRVAHHLLNLADAQVRLMIRSSDFLRLSGLRE